MDLKDILAKLDTLLASNQMADGEELLLRALKQSRSENDPASELAIINELMGMYRVLSRYAEAEPLAERALLLCSELDLAGTPQYATTLLNLATLYRAARKWPEAEKYFSEAGAIYSQISDMEYQRASFFNNQALFYMETGKYPQALEGINASMVILETLENSAVELGTAYTNMAHILTRMKRVDEAENAIEKAIRIFVSADATASPHYTSALLAKGKRLYDKKDYRQAADIFLEAMEQIHKCYGACDAYQIASKNREMALKALA